MVVENGNFSICSDCIRITNIQRKSFPGFIYLNSLRGSDSPNVTTKGIRISLVDTDDISRMTVWDTEPLQYTYLMIDPLIKPEEKLMRGNNAALKFNFSVPDGIPKACTTLKITFPDEFNDNLFYPKVSEKYGISDDIKMKIINRTVIIYSLNGELFTYSNVSITLIDVYIPYENMSTGAFQVTVEDSNSTMFYQSSMENRNMMLFFNQSNITAPSASLSFIELSNTPDFRIFINFELLERPPSNSILSLSFAEDVIYLLDFSNICAQNKPPLEKYVSCRFLDKTRFEVTGLFQGDAHLIDYNMDFGKFRFHESMPRTFNVTFGIHSSSGDFYTDIPFQIATLCSENCLRCNSSNPKICIKCSQSLYLLKNGECSATIPKEVPISETTSSSVQSSSVQSSTQSSSVQSSSELEPRPSESLVNTGTMTYLNISGSESEPISNSSGGNPISYSGTVSISNSSVSSESTESRGEIDGGSTSPSSKEPEASGGFVSPPTQISSNSTDLIKNIVMISTERCYSIGLVFGGLSTLAIYIGYLQASWGDILIEMNIAKSIISFLVFVELLTSFIVSVLEKKPIMVILSFSYLLVLIVQNIILLTLFLKNIKISRNTIFGTSCQSFWISSFSVLHIGVIFYALRSADIVDDLIGSNSKHSSRRNKPSPSSSKDVVLKAAESADSCLVQEQKIKEFEYFLRLQKILIWENVIFLFVFLTAFVLLTSTTYMINGIYFEVIVLLLFSSFVFCGSIKKEIDQPLDFNFGNGWRNDGVDLKKLSGSRMFGQIRRYSHAQSKLRRTSSMKAIDFSPEIAKLRKEFKGSIVEMAADKGIRFRDKRSNSDGDIDDNPEINNIIGDLAYLNYIKNLEKHNLAPFDKDFDEDEETDSDDEEEKI